MIIHAKTPGAHHMVVFDEQGPVPLVQRVDTERKVMRRMTNEGPKVEPYVRIEWVEGTDEEVIKAAVAAVPELGEAVSRRP